MNKVSYNTTNHYLTSKPTDDGVLKDIGYQVKHNQVHRVSRKNLYNDCTKGKVTSMCLTDENKKFLAMSHLQLDFDSGKAHYDGNGKFHPEVIIQPQEIIDICSENEIDWSFIYFSMSDTPQYPKFRLVIFLEETIVDEKEAKALIAKLAKIFPMWDRQARDLSRWFFPSKLKGRKTKLNNIKGSNNKSFLNKELSKEKMKAFIQDGMNEVKIYKGNKVSLKTQSKKGLALLRWEDIHYCQLLYNLFTNPNFSMDDGGYGVLSMQVIPFCTKVYIDKYNKKGKDAKRGNKENPIPAIEQLSKKCSKLKLGSKDWNTRLIDAQRYLDKQGNITNCKSSYCNCPYKDTCKLGDIMYLIKEKPPTVVEGKQTVEEASKRLEEEECAAVKSKDTVDILKAVCGTGKTHVTKRRLVEPAGVMPGTVKVKGKNISLNLNNKNDLIIYVESTHELINSEFKCSNSYDKVRRYEHCIDENIPEDDRKVINEDIRGKINRIQKIASGTGKKRDEFIYSEVKRLIGNENFERWKKVKEHNKKVYFAPNHCIITNEVYATMGDKILENKKRAFMQKFGVEPNIIVFLDECPLDYHIRTYTVEETFFNNNILEYCNLEEITEDYQKYEIKSSQDSKALTSLSKTDGLNDDTLDFLINFHLGGAIKLVDMKGTMVVKIKIIRPLPKANTIILSATPKDYYYKYITDQKVIIHDIGDVNYKKEFIEVNIKSKNKNQRVKFENSSFVKFENISVSNSSLRERKYFDQIKNSIDKFKKTYGMKDKKWLLVTYGDCIDYFKEIYGDEFEYRKIYNSKGLNEYKGYNIILVGTPYGSTDNIEFLAFLEYGSEYRDKFGKGNGDLNFQKPLDGNINTPRINTFNNSFLQKLHLNQIKGEVNQIISRGRQTRYESKALIIGNIDDLK